MSFDLLELALDAAQHYGATYADARLIDQESELLQTKNMTVAVFNRSQSKGMGIRVIADGGWGFASTQKLSKKAIAACAQKAVEVARASGTAMKKPLLLADEPTWQASWISPHLIDPFVVSVDDKLKILLDSAKTMLAVPGITLVQGMLQFIRDHKFFASSQGTRLEQTAIRSGCVIEANATQGDDRQRRSYPCAFGQYEQAGYEMVQKWDLPAHAQQIAEEAVALISAPLCPQGEIDTVIGSSQLGLQIHESMGHPSELDRALGQEINFAGASFLTPDMRGNLQYGSSIINLVADATVPGALGSFGFDDDGVAAQCTYLVRNGLFEGYLSSRDTAHLVGLNRSGGAMRAESWNFAPIIRMTNISLHPGSAGSLDELISDTGSGIYMETNKSWSIDSMRYNFQFSTEIAWKIKHGKRAGILKNPSYSGITPVFWNSCDAIAGSSEYIHWGTPNCGKGQPMQTMWTGHGASPARFRKLTVGIAHAD